MEEKSAPVLAYRSADAASLDRRALLAGRTVGSLGGLVLAAGIAGATGAVLEQRTLWGGEGITWAVVALVGIMFLIGGWRVARKSRGWAWGMAGVIWMAVSYLLVETGLYIVVGLREDVAPIMAMFSIVIVSFVAIVFMGIGASVTRVARGLGRAEH